MSNQPKPHKLSYLNGYGIFNQEQNFDSNVSIMERGRISGEKWKQLSDKEKEVYNQRFMKLKQQHQSELEKYYKNNPGAKLQDEQEDLLKKQSKIIHALPPGFVVFAVAHAYFAQNKINNKKQLFSNLKSYYEILTTNEKEIYAKYNKNLKDRKQQLQQDFTNLFLE